MKANIFKYITFSLFALATSACVSEEIEKGEPDLGDCMGVYFVEEQANAKTHTLEKGKDDTTLKFIVRRIKADEEVDISYKFSAYTLEKESLTDTSYKEVPVKADDVFEFGELYFEEGQKETTLEVKFDGIETGKQYHCTIYIDDPEYVSTYNYNTTSVTFAVQMFEWAKVGKAIYRDALFSDMFAWDGRYLENEIDLYQRKDKKGYYRLDNVYTSEYFARLVEGDDAYNENPEVLAASYAAYITPGTKLYLDATNPEKVYFPAQSTGFTDPSLGNLMIASDVTEVFGASSNLLYGTLKDGIITFPKNGVLLGMGGYFYFSNTSGKFRIVLPGYSAVDYAIELEAEEIDETGNIPVTFTLAKDVAKVRYAIFEGNVSDVNLESKIEEVKTSAKAVEFTHETGKSTTQTFNLKPSGSEAKTGMYTLIACTYAADGSYKEYASVKFGYVMPGDSKDVQIDFGVIVSDRYASDIPSQNYSAENSFQYWVRGKEITQVMINYYPTSYYKTYEDKIKSDLANYGSLDSGTLKRLNSSELSGVVGNDLLAGTSYTFVIYAGNGYHSTYFTKEFKTEGEKDWMKQAFYFNDLLETQPSADAITSDEWIPVSVDLFDAYSTGRTIRGNFRANSVKMSLEDGKMKAAGLFPALKENPTITFDYKDGLIYMTENTLDEVTIKDSTNVVPSMRYEYTYIPKPGCLSQNGYFFDTYEKDGEERHDMMVAGFVHDDIIAFMDNRTTNIFWSLILGGYQKYGSKEVLQNIIGDGHGDLLLVRKGSPLLEGLQKSESSVMKKSQTLNSVSTANCISMPEINSIIRNIDKFDIAHEAVEFSVSEE